MFSVDNLTYGTLGILGLICIIIQKFVFNTETQVTSSRNPDFLYLQRSFFIVYYFALFSDWLQGPYVYQLYSSYGYDESDIAVLYLVGFGSSMLFGTAIGSLADKFGRKLMCVLFSVLYIVCCITKISPNYYILLIGRILGGIATSILFSSFEAWYVHEHVQKYKFPISWVSVTFSNVTFFNGILAITAGIIANVITENLNYGPVAPFILAIPCLICAGSVALMTWPENYDSTLNIHSLWCDAIKIIINNHTILLLGIIQAIFESVMYIFIFLWTPLLKNMHPPLGIIFACFMICIMMGSSIYSILLSKNFKSEIILSIACTLAFISNAIFTYTTLYDHTYISFFACLILELAVGMYFPSISSLRSEILPEKYRANLINWFRVPMNAITCGTLLWLHNTTQDQYANHKIFSVCSILMVLATFLALQFSKSMIKNNIITINTISDHFKLNNDSNKQTNEDKILIHNDYHKESQIINT